MATTNSLISNVEKQFIVDAANQTRPDRVDGRRPFDYRSVNISFPGRLGAALVQIGRTRAFARVASDLVTPSPERPAEGHIRFFVDAGPDRESSALLSNLLEKCIRDSGAIDMETLCVLSGVKAWHLRVDVSVIDESGNSIDCICLAALAALRHFSRPAVTVIGTELVVHSMKDRAPIPLQLHHLPICTTFAVIGDVIIVDPTNKESAVAGAHLTIASNIRKHLCLISKSGGTPIDHDQLTNCIRLACDQATIFSEMLQSSVESDLQKRREQLEKGGVLVEADAPKVVVEVPARIRQAKPMPEPMPVSDSEEDEDINMNDIVVLAN